VARSRTCISAPRHGVTIAEIEKVVLHCAIYCGVPVANAAFNQAEEVLATGAPE
jgi:alkylhydroperoxidase/carboxymuconolactone decarboxylase family protein YurZ